MLPKLQYISHGNTEEEQLSGIKDALENGCELIQLRFKNVGEVRTYKLAQIVKPLCDTHDAMLIINDYAELAKEIKADGVHLGLDDMPVEEARDILGNHAVIGRTANTFDDVLEAWEKGCDYIGLGPFRFTTTKEKLSPVLSLEGMESILEQVQLHRIPVPIFAIGGIVEPDIEELIRAGIYGIAASSMITNSTNKKALIQRINNTLYETTNYSRETI